MTEQTPAPIFAEGETVTYYKPAKTALDINGKPFREGGRVITRVPSKEFEVIYATHHENETLKEIYNEFKLADDKSFWLSNNRARLEKFDINVDNIKAKLNSTK